MFPCAYISEDNFFMKRYVFPSVILRAETGKNLVRNRLVETSQSFLRYHHSRCNVYTFSVYNIRHRHCYVRSDLDDKSGLLRLMIRRPLSSTITETDSLIASPENDNNEGVFLTRNTLQQLKKDSVEDVAHTFFNHCNLKENNFDPHLELIAILETLHDNPQTSERFIRTLQELANNNASTGLDFYNDDEKGIHNQGEYFRPRRDHYHMVLKAWLNFAPPSAKRAQALLDYMEENAAIQYETESCNHVLKAWAENSNAERTQKFFDTMIRKRTQLDLVSFSHVLRAWSKSKSPLAVNRVEAMLLHVETATSFKPNAECYLRVIECWAKCKRKGSEARIETLIGLLNERLANDTGHSTMNVTNEGIRQIATSNLLQVYHKIGNAHRAEEILLEFVKDFETNAESPPPTIGMCISVLSTWSKSPSGRRASRAEKLLHLMDNNEAFPQPDTTCYTAVLNCIASSKKQGSAKRAEALLRRMDRKEETKSNMVSLTCVIIAWARCEDLDAPIKAERIFQEILDRGMQPDRYVFAGLITAWGRSNDQDSISKVEDYFRRLKCLQESKPTVVEYTAVIQAYANCVSRNIDQSRELVQRAEDLLTEMLNSEDGNLRPNILSYAAVLKTIAAARRIPDRGERAEKVLQKMLSDRVDIPPYIMNLVDRCNSRITT